MKKIFTLMVTGLIMSAAYAQYDPKDEWSQKDRQEDYREDDWDKYERFDKHDKHDNRRKTFYMSPRERDMQINRIDREYDYKIRSVQNRFFMSRREKMYQINLLQQQKQQEIRMVMMKFNSRRNTWHRQRYGNW
jgi:hypothetical protein